MESYHDLCEAKEYARRFKERTAKKKKKTPRDSGSGKKHFGQSPAINQYLEQLRKRERLSLQDRLGLD